MLYASFLTFALVGLPIALAAQINVDVGPGGNFVFSPEFVTASVSDTVKFTFHPKNHSVTQSSFEQPCVPLAGGTDSGFKPVASDDVVPAQTFEWIVTNSNPVWIHCEQQPGHCGKGMVFAINPPMSGDKTFEAFKARAISLNGTASASPPAPSDAYVTPPAPQWASATATVTLAESVWTTTYSSYDGTPPPTPAAQPQDHKITVGGANGEFIYIPANITAAIGDTVTFEFHPKNHTVTQSSFLNPCQSLTKTSTTGQVGFASGFKPVAADATEFPQFQITINDTAPIWGYCGQVGHCASGMVFAINAVESGPNNFAAFVGLAKRTGAATPAGNSTTPASGAVPSPTSTKDSGALSQAAIPYSATLIVGAVAMLFVTL